MESTNVDYLLRNYTVADVLQVQQKLKSEVEKKQNDLKSLIGERYHELFRATDSFKNMQSSVDELISSLQQLNVIVQENREKVNHSFETSSDENYFIIATICKFLIDWPLKIWNFLHRENYVHATYCSFYGKHISEYLRQSLSKENNICVLKSNSIENFTFNIIQNCWLKINRQSTCDQFECYEFADIFSCLTVLKNRSLEDIIQEFFSKQTKHINVELNEKNQLSSLIEIILNIIFNTTKCSGIFRKISNEESLFVKRFKFIVSFNFFTETFDNNNSHLTRLPNHLIDFTIESSLRPLSFYGMENEDVINQSSIGKWIDTVRENFYPIIKEKFKIISSVKQLFFEIVAVEKKQVERNKFQQWKEFIDILDIENLVWKKWFINAFEDRVYAITEQVLNSIIETFSLQLSSAEQILISCDLNIVDFVWKESTSKNNDFINLILKTCEMIDERLQSLYEDIVIFRDNHQHFLEKIYLSIHRFLSMLKEHIDSCTSIKPFIIFGAILFQKLPELSPSLNLIFSIRNDHHLKEWNKMENQLRAISESYLIEWFSLIISIYFNQINPITFSDLTECLRNLTLWEKISVSGDDEEKTSTIQVPFQLSLVIFEILQNICIDINRFCAHTVPRNVIIEMLILIGKHLLDFYASSIKSFSSNDSIPKATKQIISIQLYFDLFFVKKIFTNFKHDILRIDYLSKINDLMTSLEENIDPFDMHLIHPHLEANSEKLHRSYQITFGFLYPTSNLMTMYQTNNGLNQNKEFIHNLMLYCNCTEEFKIIKSNSAE